MNFALAHATRIGGRHTNEDCVGHWSTPEAALMVVADGLGGHLRGDLAAQTAVELLGAAFLREAQPRIADPAAFFARALEAAHAAILHEGQRLELPETPRTVIVACLVQDGHACWTHVGDCRFYLIREGRILTRTRDHTVVQRLIDEGHIREEALSSHPERNRLLQCLGGYVDPNGEPAQRVPLAKGDILLLCSDGFWGPLTQGQMLDVLVSRELRIAVPELAELAELRAGLGADNVSALAMFWGDEGDRAIEDVSAGASARPPAARRE
ncbi:MAG TPA: PP2C family serine/threonine-protein phosphatase [Burkholderiales bacterium]|nr:PP2C family serine/threonine-protein phosphatase [Burkholderiales bacterium]